MQRDQLLAGRYRLLERLGSGGMSAVHRAYDEVLERDVAVKVLVGSDTDARRRIRGEAKAAARLSHPYVTGVYDYGESEVDGAQVPFVVMELLGGRTLEHRLAVGPLPPRAGLRVCAEVASALAAAHEQGLVHRDIKPGNVMLTPTGAKVLDFGIAAAAGAPEIDFEGRLMGTPAYLAPERLRAGDVLPASDVYALGLLLHRVLTGRLPWPAEPPVQVRHLHPHVEPDPLPPIDGVPPEVYRLYRWCLADDPADRPPATDAAGILFAAASGVAPDAVAVAAESPATVGKPNSTESAGTESAGTGSTDTESNSTGSAGAVPPGGSAERVRRVPWRRRRAVLTVGGAVIAAVALAGSLGDFSNRRVGQSASPTASGPGTTTVGMPSIEEPTVDLSAGPSAVPTGRSPAPATRIGPSTAPGGTVAPGPTPTMAGPTPTRAAPTPTPTPGDGVPVDARGGTVTARCVGKSVEVLAVTAKPEFRVEAYDPGPAKQIVVVLTSAEHRSEIRVQCPAGRLKPKVMERTV